MNVASRNKRLIWIFVFKKFINWNFIKTSI